MRTPDAAASSAADFVRPSTACLLTGYMGGANYRRLSVPRCDATVRAHGRLFQPRF
jgi:hypothetical protein